MKAIRLLGMANVVTLLFLDIASGTAAAQSTKVQGIIKSRSGPDITPAQPGPEHDCDAHR